MAGGIVGCQEKTGSKRESAKTVGWGPAPGLRSQLLHGLVEEVTILGIINQFVATTLVRAWEVAQTKQRSAQP